MISGRIPDAQRSPRNVAVLSPEPEVPHAHDDALLGGVGEGQGPDAVDDGVAGGGEGVEAIIAVSGGGPGFLKSGHVDMEH